MSLPLHCAPRIKPIEGLDMALRAELGADLLELINAADELTLVVARAAVARVLATLRDRFAYQQLMEIAGVDYPARAERFEVAYHLLSVTKNHRLRVKASTDEDHPVPTVTHLWPVAGWLEREVFDMYGVLFEGNTDLRRILTDYGFKGHPFRKDFPLTGQVEMRYSEEAKRVVYEPVRLPQDFRNFDFLSPWEGAQYVLPGDEKAQGAAPGAPTPVPASPPPPAAPAAPPPAVREAKTTDHPGKTGAGEPANALAAKPSGARKPRATKVTADESAAKPKAPRTRKAPARKGDA